MDQNIQAQNLTSDTSAAQAVNLIAVESLIVSHNSRLDSLKKEMNQFQDMLDGILDNHPEYPKKLEIAKAAAKEKNAVKAEIMKDPKAMDLFKKIKDYRSQLNELKSALSDYLKQYQQLSGSNQIEGPDGIVREIVYTAKLVNRADTYKK